MTVGASLLAEVLDALEHNAELRERVRRLLAPASASADDLIDAHNSGLSVREFRRAIRTGALVGSKVGRRYVCTRAALDAYLTKRRVQAAPARERVRPSTPAQRAIAKAQAEGRLRAVA